MWFILTIILGLTLILSTLTTVPVIVAVFLCFTVSFKKSWVLLAALIAGLISDLLFLRTMGATALFLVAFEALVLVYQRRFEIQTVVFVLISSFLGSMAYLKIFGGSNLILQALISSLITIIIFKTVGKSKLFNSL